MLQVFYVGKDIDTTRRSLTANAYLNCIERDAKEVRVYTTRESAIQVAKDETKSTDPMQFPVFSATIKGPLPKTKSFYQLEAGQRLQGVRVELKDLKFTNVSLEHVHPRFRSVRLEHTWQDTLSSLTSPGWALGITAATWYIGHTHLLAAKMASFLPDVLAGSTPYLSSLAIFSGSWLALEISGIGRILSYPNPTDIQPQVTPELAAALTKAITTKEVVHEKLEEDSEKKDFDSGVDDVYESADSDVDETLHNTNSSHKAISEEAPARKRGNRR